MRLYGIARPVEKRRFLVTSTWLSRSAVVWLAVSIVTAGALLIDVYLRSHRQHMRVMEALWPITALYFGPFTRPFHVRYGRPQGQRWQHAPR